MHVVRTAVGLVAIFLAVLTGCGQKAEEQTSTETPATDVGAMDTIDYSKYGEHADDAREIQRAIDDTIERLRYGDKSGLYENEFSYFREEKTFDDYLQHGEVTWANADSLDHVEILDIIFLEGDSALVDANFHLITADGKVEPSYVRWVAYHHKGRWIKPYMSRIQFQLEFDERIRQADEDARGGW